MKNQWKSALYGMLMMSILSPFYSTFHLSTAVREASSPLVNKAPERRTILAARRSGGTTRVKSSFNEQTKSDATVIVLSSYIPTHPSIHMINRTIASVRSMIHGLHDPKIIITVDGIPLTKPHRRRRRAKGSPVQFIYQVENITLVEEKIDKVEKYTDTLRKYFYNDPSVMILSHAKHLHISNNIQNALDYVDTKYVYIVQHDFEFIRQVNHTEIINAMENDPEVLRIVRFDKGNDQFRVMNFQRRLKKNGCNVQKYKKSQFMLAQWSDNNHITTKKYYREAYEMMGPTPRPVEGFFMANWNKLNCYVSNQWLYKYEPGNPFLNHLDGRQTISLANFSGLDTTTG